MPSFKAAGRLSRSSAAMQASAIDEDKVIHQHNPQPIDLMGAPYHHLMPMVRSAAARNRTKRAEDSGDERRGLEEIDEHATTSSTKKLDRNALMILDMVTTTTTTTTTKTNIPMT